MMGVCEYFAAIMVGGIFVRGLRERGYHEDESLPRTLWFSGRAVRRSTREGLGQQAGRRKHAHTALLYESGQRMHASVSSYLYHLNENGEDWSQAEMRTDSPAK